MKRGINKAILVGTLTGEPQYDKAPNGSVVVNFRMDTVEMWKDGREEKSRTETHRVVLFGKLAEAVYPLLYTGAPIYVEGQLRTREYTGRDGIERKSTEIFGAEIRVME